MTLRVFGRSFAVATVVCLASGLLAQGAPPATADDKPSQPAAVKPDRSAESTFRKLLEQTGKLGNFHAVMASYSRGGEDSPYLYSSASEFWYRSQTVFRWENAPSMGGPARKISDGTTLLDDPLDFSRAATLRKVGKDMIATDASFDIGRRGGSPLFALLGGPSVLENLLPADSFVVNAPGWVGMQGVRLGARGAGVLTVYWSASDPLMLPRRFEWDATTDWRERMKTSGKGFAEPGPRLTRQEVFYKVVNGKLDDGLFVATAPKGVRVTDQRNATPGTQATTRPPEDESEGD